MNRLFTLPVTWILALGVFAHGSEVGPSVPLGMAAAARVSEAKLEPAHVADSVSLEVGNSQFHLNNGTVGVVTLDGVPLGFYFKGIGSLNYVSADATEFATMAYNLGKNTKLELHDAIKGKALNYSFSEAFFWWSGRPLPVFEGAAAPSLEADYKAYFKKLENVKIGSEINRFLVRAFNAPQGQWVGAEMSGKADDAVYDYDGYENFTESFSILRSTKDSDAEVADWLMPHTISEQPVGWKRNKPLPYPYILASVDVELEAPKDTQAKMVVKETIVPRQTGMKALHFALYNKIYESLGRGKYVPHYYHVVRITDGTGKELPFHHQEDDLIVELPEPSTAKQPIQLSFSIDGDFLIRPRGDSYWQLGTEPWFPQPPLAGQSFTFHSIVKVKKPWSAFAPGNTVRRTVEGDYNVVETRCDKPIAFGVILAGDYSFQEETRNGLTVRVATYALKSNKSSSLIDIAFHIIKYYEGFLGPYPFKDFNILEKNEWGYGQAPASIMFITKEAFNQTMDEVNQVYSEGIRQRFAHEIAHQWWGTLVKMPNIEEQWITESFAEYTSALCMLDWKGKGEYQKKVNQWKNGPGETCGAEIASGRSTIPMANRIWNEKFWYTEQMQTRTALIYYKGAYLLYAIHKEIGDDAFFKFLNAFQKSCQWKFGTTQDVVNILGLLTKKDWNTFFNNYYWDTGFPVVKD